MIVFNIISINGTCFIKVVFNVIVIMFFKVFFIWNYIKIIFIFKKFMLDINSNPKT